MSETKHVNLFGYQVKLRTVTMIAVIFGLALAFLWAVLLSGWPAVHDPTHWFRHSLGFIPCH
jgi:cobalt transporter subunit CbtB